MKGTLTYTIEELPCGDELLRATVEVSFTASAYDPGNTSGPPEWCYPPEGGEVEEIAFTLTAANCDGEDWHPEVVTSRAAVVLAAVQEWYDNGPGNEILGELIGQCAAEARYDDELDYYDPRDYNLGPDAPGQGNW